MCMWMALEKVSAGLRLGGEVPQQRRVRVPQHRGVEVRQDADFRDLAYLVARFHCKFGQGDC